MIAGLNGPHILQKRLRSFVNPASELDFIATVNLCSSLGGNSKIQMIFGSVQGFCGR